MSEHIYLVTLSFPFITALIIFGMKYYAAIQQARANEAYRQLAAQAAAQQADMLTTLTALRATAAETAVRLAAVEKLLKQVE
ncbi:hypothetical protein ACHMW6_31870 [Pseudoduganella sp. UC29_106]|uniref:hypothetical protein n=1 Tax=Pseudoduganella sp. UC29_106 TaxID=3374553 RepID=UPI003757F5F9